MLKIFGDFDTHIKGGFEMSSTRDILEAIVTCIILVLVGSIVLTHNADSPLGAGIVTTGLTGVMTYWFTRSGIAVGQSAATIPPATLAPVVAAVDQKQIDDAVAKAMQNIANTPATTPGAANAVPVQVPIR